MIQSSTIAEMKKNRFLQRATLKHHLNKHWLGQMTVVCVAANDYNMTNCQTTIRSKL